MSQEDGCGVTLQWSDKENIQLFQVSEDILKNLKAGGSLTVKSNGTEASVLCTEDQTFQLKEVVQSNSLFAAMDEGSSIHLAGDVSSYFELEQVSGAISIDDLLPIYDGHIRGPTQLELFSVASASKREIEKACAQRCVANIDGHLMLVGSRRIEKLLQVVFNLGDNVSRQELLEALEAEERIEICAAVVDFFTRSAAVHEPHIRFDEEKLCRWIGINLLTSHQVISHEDLIEKWKEAMPSQMAERAQLASLKGEYLEDGPRVVYFPASQLPVDPPSRYAYLFKHKAKWPVSEIWNYVADVAPSKAKSEALMLKYGRKQTEGGVQFLTARNKWLK